MIRIKYQHIVSGPVITTLSVGDVYPVKPSTDGVEGMYLIRNISDPTLSFSKGKLAVISCTLLLTKGSKGNPGLQGTGTTSKHFAYSQVSSKDRKELTCLGKVFFNQSEPYLFERVISIAFEHDTFTCTWEVSPIEDFSKETVNSRISQYRKSTFSLIKGGGNS